LYLQNVLKDYIQHRIENRLARPLEALYGPLAEGPVEAVLEEARPYIHESFEGETILSLGKMKEMYHQGASGLISVGPFTCMPTTIVSGIARNLSADCGGIPIITITYDGQHDPTLQTRLEAFAHQVRHFAERHPQARPVAL